MNVWQSTLATVALLTALLCSGSPRALLWIAVGALDFVVTAIWQAADLPAYPFFTAMVDASVCLAIYLIGRYQWEVYLFIIFQLSVLVSILRLFGTIDSNYSYVTALEACNWLALLVIAGTHIARAIDGRPWLGIRADRNSGIHRLVLTLFAPKAKIIGRSTHR